MVSLYLLQDREVLIISSSRKHWTDRHSHLFKSIFFSVHCTRLYLAVRSERNMLSFLGKSSWASPKRSFTVTLIISGSTSAKEPGTASTSNEYFSRKQTLINRARCLGCRHVSIYAISLVWFGRALISYLELYYHRCMQACWAMFKVKRTSVLGKHDWSWQKL